MEHLHDLFALIMASASLAVLLYDLRQRAKDREDLAAATKEAKKAAEALSDLHNKQIGQLAEVSNKVSAHEMILKAQTTSNNAMKRF